MHALVGMSEHPVHYTIERPARFSRLQLLMRFVAFCALGLIGLSFGSLFAFAFLALPETLRLEVHSTAHPTPASAMWRLLSGIPSALVLAILCWLGMFVWLWAALSILFVQRVGQHAFEYLVGLQRWSIRLLAYQASLVDEYPPFSFADTPSSMLPVARVAPPR